jgi:hypothetical protein
MDGQRQIRNRMELARAFKHKHNYCGRVKCFHSRQLLRVRIRPAAPKDNSRLANAPANFLPQATMHCGRRALLSWTARVHGELTRNSLDERSAHVAGVGHAFLVEGIARILFEQAEEEYIARLSGRSKDSPAATTSRFMFPECFGRSLLRQTLDRVQPSAANARTTVAGSKTSGWANCPLESNRRRRGR